MTTTAAGIDRLKAAAANAAAALEAIRMLQEEPEHMERVRANTAWLRAGLNKLGLAMTPSTTPVVPVLLGDEFKAYRWARRLPEALRFLLADFREPR